ncbi:MAG: ABC transporter substrate-binding protein, partial [Pirellulales bacterium]
IYHDPDKLVPGIAESWEFDKDKLEYTIHLRRGVKWHPMSLPDGTELPETELTADDVMFTYACILNPSVEAAALRSYYEDPDAEDESKRYKIKATKVDDYTVKVEWTKPYFLADEFTLGVPIVPEHVYSVNETGDPISFDYASKEFADGFNNHWANTKMCGTGPLIFKEWVKNERLVLERNPNYWGEPFYFERVTFQCITNPNTVVQKLLQNELDWAIIVQKDQYVQNQEHANVKTGKVKLVAYDYPGYIYVGYNQQRELFKDKRVRRAMGHAIPVDEIIKEVMFGLARRTTGPFLPGSSSYDESLAPLDFDLEKAKALLDEAGWKDTDQNGVRDKMIEGAKVEAQFDLSIPADIPAYRTVAEIAERNLRLIGVKVLVSPAKWDLMLQKQRKKEFDATIIGWGMSWKQDPFQIFHGSQADVPESSNSIGYKNPEVDRLIETLRETMEVDEQIKIYHQIHGLIYEDQPYTFLYVSKRTAGHDSRLENVAFYKLRPCIDPREWGASRVRQQ